MRSSLLANEAGKLYGMWEVLDRPIPLMTKAVFLWCRCTLRDCGITRLVLRADMVSGKSTSCGGHHRENLFYAGLPKAIHTVLRQRYNRIQVSTDPNGKNKAFAAYRRRGIQNKFGSAEEFVRYMVAELPHESYVGVEIDRIDNDGHYEPGNLKLSTRMENAQNRSTNIMVEWNGESMSATKFAREAKIDLHPSTVIDMVKRGMTPEQIIAHRTPRQKRRCTT